MAVIKKFDLVGNEVGEIQIEDHLLEATANSQMIKDYLVAIRNNARQWSANTKTRPEVNHSGQKPHPQKGTGRARQGYLGSPQYKGGGRVFTPRPKFDQHVRINKKEKRLAITHLLAEKIQNGRLCVLQYGALQQPKTKAVADFLRSRDAYDKRVLFLGEGSIMASESPSIRHDSFIKSMRNMPKKRFMFLPNISGYDVILASDIVIMDSALDELKVCLQSGV